MRALLSLVLGFALLLAVPVDAGSADDPELGDATGDATHHVTGQNACPGGDCEGPAAVADIERGWIIEAEDRLTFVMQVVSAEANKLYGPQEHRVFFTLGGTEYEAGIRLGTSSTAGGDDSIAPLGVADAARLGADQYEWDVPRAAIGAPSAGDVLEGIYMTSYQQGGTVGDMEDRAPDADGVTYTLLLGAGDAQATPFYFDVDGNDLNLSAAYTNSTNRVEVYNWTQPPSDAEVSLTIEGTGSVSIRITGNDAEHLNATYVEGTHNQTLTDAVGPWVVNLTLTDFNGSYSLRIGPAADADASPGDEDADGSPDGDADGPSDDDGGADPAAETDGDSQGNTTGTVGEESPAWFAPILMALLVIVARRR